MLSVMQDPAFTRISDSQHQKAKARDVASAAMRRRRKELSARGNVSAVPFDGKHITNVQDVSTSAAELGPLSRITLVDQDGSAACSMDGSMRKVQLEWLHGRLDAQLLMFERAYWKLMTGLLIFPTPS